jgi:DNA polymerase-3 subunit gamma/tau
MEYQSLYRRYRPGRFGEIVGQQHVVAALRNAVGTDRVGHAYLFSGPRGTGKTSTARILAKALNCEDLAEGEPCGSCGSCTAIAAGTSYELHELDAASHNKVDDIRDLISKVAIGSPGRTKVYVLDEVHMLSAGAENALLKTLEEPPPHVVFVLCTTEAHKVTQTIRSRTQHLHFELLDADLLERHVRAVAADARLDVSDDDIGYVMAAGGGSARDALSALDAVAAAGRAPDGGDAVAAVIEALATGDTAAALIAADAAARAGQEPRIIGEALLGRLRHAFLASVEAPMDHIPAAERAAAADLAGRLRPRVFTFALEMLGQALVQMREAPDPRVDLDLALVRLTSPDIGVTLHSLAERVERLEQAGSAGTPPAQTARPTTPPARPAAPSPRAAPAPAPESRGQSEPGPDRRRSKVAMLRETLATASTSPAPRAATDAVADSAVAGEAATAPPEVPDGPRERAPSSATGTAESRPSSATGTAESRPSSPAGPRERQPVSPGEAAAPPPDRDEAVLAWADEVLPSLPKAARALLAGGRFLPNAATALRLGVPTPGFLVRCEPHRADVEAAFGRYFDRSVTVEFVRDDSSTTGPPTAGAGGSTASPLLGEIVAAASRPVRRPADVDRSGVEQVQQAFPGARLFELETSP